VAKKRIDRRINKHDEAFQIVYRLKAASNGAGIKNDELDKLFDKLFLLIAVTADICTIVQTLNLIVEILGKLKAGSSW
jgi:hypothetical protein